MTRKDEEATSRRDFLKTAATAAPLAAVAVATATGTEVQLRVGAIAAAGVLGSLPDPPAADRNAVPGGACLLALRRPEKGRRRAIPGGSASGDRAQAGRCLSRSRWMEARAVRRRQVLAGNSGGHCAARRLPGQIRG